MNFQALWQRLLHVENKTPKGQTIVFDMGGKNYPNKVINVGLTPTGQYLKIRLYNVK